MLDRTRTQPRKFRRLRRRRLDRCSVTAARPRPDPPSRGRRARRRRPTPPAPDDPADPTDQTSGASPARGPGHRRADPPIAAPPASPEPPVARSSPSACDAGSGNGPAGPRPQHARPSAIDQRSTDHQRADRRRLLACLRGRGRRSRRRPGRAAVARGCRAAPARATGHLEATPRDVPLEAIRHSVTRPRSISPAPLHATWPWSRLRGTRRCRPAVGARDCDARHGATASPRRAGQAARSTRRS